MHLCRPTRTKRLVSGDTDASARVNPAADLLGIYLAAL